MSDFIVVLPPQAKNIKPAMLTYEREGKDGNEILLPFFGGDNFVGEVLSGKWQRYFDPNMTSHDAYISGGTLYFGAQSDGSGTARIGTLTSKSQILIREGLTVEMQFALSEIPASNGHALSLVFAPEYEPEDPEGSPENCYNFIFFAGSSNYSVWVKQNLDGTATYPLAGTNITNSNCKYKIVFFSRDGKLKYHLYMHDGSGPFTDDDEVANSPFDWECPFNVAYVYLRYWTNHNAYMMAGSDYITVDYGADVNIPQLVKFDLPIGAKTGVETLFTEAEDEDLNGGADTEDLGDDSGTSARLNAQNESVSWQVGDGALSAGRYLALFKIKDTDQIADDVWTKVERDDTWAKLNIEQGDITWTVEGVYKIYEMVFDVPEDFPSDTSVNMRVQKLTTTSNTIYVDWFRIIPYTGDGGRCKCFDTMGEASEDSWVEVFSADHVFVGECVIQNGVIRAYIDELVVDGIKLYYWSGNAWTRLTNYPLFGLRDDSLPLQYHMLRHLISIDSYEVNLRGLSLESAVDNRDWYMDWKLTLRRGSHAFEFSEFTPAPPQDIYYYDAGGFRFGFVNDAETHGIGDADLPLTASNTTMTDNFMLAFDDEGSPYILVITVSKTMTTKLEAYQGGNLYAIDVDSEVHDTVKLIEAFIPFSKIANLFFEAEDGTLQTGATVDSGESDDSGDSVLLNAQYEATYVSFTGGVDLPLGRYLCLVRAKDSNQISEDLHTYVENFTEGRHITELTGTYYNTCAATFGFHQMVFEIIEDDVGDEIIIRCFKNTVSANDIHVDYYLIIPISDGLNFPQDVAHNSLRVSRKSKILIDPRLEI